MSADKLREAAANLRKSAEFTNEKDGAFLKAVAVLLDDHADDPATDPALSRIARAWLRERP